MKTWHIEVIIVMIILSLQLFFTNFSINEIICSCAVLFTFKHAQIADRMQERQSIMEKPDVHCYKWSNRYFILKEAMWICFFLMTKSYAALSGAILFSLYPLWRKYWRRMHPIKINEK